MRLLPILALLSLAPVASFAAAAPCVALEADVDCGDVAVSVFGSAHGGFVAVSGTGDASTMMDRCLEWICPSAAVSATGDAHGGCRASSVCVAVAGRGHASHDGIGASFGGCDVVPKLCATGLP